VYKDATFIDRSKIGEVTIGKRAKADELATKRHKGHRIIPHRFRDDRRWGGGGI
jgi:hypothetical protein